MFGRSVRSILLRLIFCGLLAVGLWCRSQVANDGFYLQFPGLIRLEIANSLTGVEFDLQVNSASGIGNEFFGGESQTKYRRSLWRHIYFSSIADLWSNARGGMGIQSKMDRYTKEMEVYSLIPHALIGVFIFAIVDLEAGMHKRRRRHAPGLCQACGYDVRGNTGRCSECGILIPPPSSLKARSKIKRYSRRCSIFFAVGFLAVHAFIGYVQMFATYLSANCRAIDAMTLHIIQFPIHYDTQATMSLDPTLMVILALTLVVNSMLWGWTIAWVAWLALMTQQKFTVWKKDDAVSLL